MRRHKRPSSATALAPSRLALVVVLVLTLAADGCPFLRRRGLRAGTHNLTAPHPQPAGDGRAQRFETSNTTMAALTRIAAARSKARGGPADIELVREEIQYILEHPEPWNYDDGSWGPIALRLAWHAAASWDPSPPAGEPRGGSQGGASMRFEPEAVSSNSMVCASACVHTAEAVLGSQSYEENRGLDLPRAFLEPIRLL
jgi:hypothetical protein